MAVGECEVEGDTDHVIVADTEVVELMLVLLLEVHVPLGVSDSVGVFDSVGVDDCEYPGVEVDVIEDDSVAVYSSGATQSSDVRPDGMTLDLPHRQAHAPSMSCTTSLFVPKQFATVSHTPQSRVFVILAYDTGIVVVSYTDTSESSM